MAYYNFEYSGQTFQFEKDESDSEKVIVFACAKNEDDYINEWVEHYLNLGFDKIIIADNNDSPEPLRNLLSKWINNGQVQIFECNGLKKFQLYIYNMFLHEGNYKWCAYFDCDEFLELNSHASIKGFLSGIEEDCVLINWMVFGSNGNIHKGNGLLKERFKCPVSPVSFFKENFYVKPIIRGGSNNMYLTNTHCPLYCDKMNIGGYYTVDYSRHVYSPVRYKYAYIRHYYTKSFDEWVSNKVKRGWPDEMFDILKPSNYFIADKNVDFEIDKFINGFFVDNNSLTEQSIKEMYDDIMGKYEMIHLFSSSRNIYGIFIQLFSLMRYYTDHLFVVSGEYIDDSTFALMLWYGMLTGNRVAFSFDQSDLERIFFEKTTWNKNLFYYINCE